MPPRIRAYATCSPGLEAVLSAELAALGCKPAPAGTGGVPFSATTRQLYVAIRWLRTSTRVVVRGCREECRGVSDVHRVLRNIEWSAYLAPGSAVRTRVTTRGTRVDDRVLVDAVVDAIGAAVPGATVRADNDPAADDIHQLVVVRMVKTRLTVSFDTSGENLARRGWRKATGKAPLLPTLAAAGLRSIGWDGAVPLVDPMCGAGTIAIEAALIASGRPPSPHRPFAVEHWPSFAPGTWASAGVDGRPDEAAAVRAADRDAGAVAATTSNASRAQVHVPVAEQSVSDLPALVSDLPVGVVVTNPPWGDRLGTRDLRNLYATLGTATERAGWRLALWTTDRVLAGHAGLPTEPLIRTTAGGIPIGFYADASFHPGA